MWLKIMTIGTITKGYLSTLIQSMKDYIQNKSILLPGGAGFIGSWLAGSLVRLGASVTVVDSLVTASFENIKHLVDKGSVKFIEADVLTLDYDTLGRYDFVVYLAARPSPDDYVRHPVETLLVSSVGLLKALEAARKWDAVLLFTSTSEVYGDAEIIPTPETYWGKVNPIGPRSCYDEGKRFGEALCMAYLREYGLDVRIARIFNTYGPRMDWKNPSAYGRVVIKFIVQALKNEPITIYGDGKQTRSFCFISDCVDALIRMMTIPEARGEVINIGNPEEITILELARIIKELTGSSSTIIHLPPRPDDPRRRCPDITKARKILKWEPKVPLRQGLKITIDWVKERLST